MCTLKTWLKCSNPSAELHCCKICMKHKIKTDKQRLKRGCLFERLKMQKRQYDLWMKVRRGLMWAKHGWNRTKIGEIPFFYSIYENNPAPHHVLIFHTCLFKLLRAELLKHHIYLHFRAWLMKNIASQQGLWVECWKSNTVGRLSFYRRHSIEPFQMSLPSCVYISDNLDFS